MKAIYFLEEFKLFNPVPRKNFFLQLYIPLLFSTYILLTGSNNPWFGHRIALSSSLNVNIQICQVHKKMAR